MAIWLCFLTVVDRYKKIIRKILRKNVSLTSNILQNTENVQCNTKIIS